MIRRLCNLPKNKSFFLFGPRQTGKSSLIQSHWTQDVWVVDLLKNENFIKYSKSPEIFRKEVQEKVIRNAVKTVVVDEIQKVPALLNEVHSLIESLSCQFILTGSSARKLRRGSANLLGGRAVQRYLFPFVYEEIKDQFDLNSILQFGSLPAIHEKSNEEKIDILKTYTDTYLREEIQAEGLVRNLGGFSRFLDMVAAQCGELINYTNMSREVQINAKSIQAYYQILEDTLVGFSLHPWQKSARKRLTAHPKFYLFDTGVTNGINRRLTAEIDPVLRGRLFEQWMILETYRLISYHASEARIYYWRTNNGAEVDLLIEKHGKIKGAFEIKSSHNVSGRDLTGLRSFHEDSKENKSVPLYLIAPLEEPYNLNGTHVIPWKKYLEEILPECL